jgi:N-terminal domain of anti-restriction factor ArdC
VAYHRSAAQQAEAEARRAELLGKLADGIDKLADSVEWQRYLDCQSKFHHYSFNNTLLILSQMPTATQVASFKKWQELGRNVIKGETSLRIFAPSTRKVEVETPEGETEQRTQLSGFRLAPVFDVSQTEGEALPEAVHLLDGEAPEGVFGKLTRVAESIGFTVQVTPEVDGHPGANGLCEYEPKLITVAGNRSGAQKVKSLVHEIGHAMLHGKPEAGLTRNTCELEAESVAYVTCQQLGMDTSDYSFGYALGWKANDPEKAREAIKASGARIHQATKSIIDGLEMQAEKTAEPEHQAEVADYEPELEVA